MRSKRKARRKIAPILGGCGAVKLAGLEGRLWSANHRVCPFVGSVVFLACVMLYLDAGKVLKNRVDDCRGDICGRAAT